MLSNGAKVRRFQEEAKRAFKGQQHIPLPSGAPRGDPAVRSTLGLRAPQAPVFQLAGAHCLDSLAGAGAACGAEPDTPVGGADWASLFLN